MKRLLFFLLAVTSWAACTPDSRGICVTGLAAIQDNLLGPLIPFGNSPWTFFDAAEQAVADNMGAAAVVDAPALGTALSGTVSLTSGNNFLTTTADLTTPLSGKVWVIVAWTSIDGAATGRLQCPISSVTATQINCTESMTVPSFSGATAYQLAAADSHGIDSTYWTTENPSFTWNYYDAAIGFYRLYYRTGTTTYQTYARDFADYTWQWTLDHGYRRVSPRASSMISQFFRALDGHSERFPGLYNWINMVLPSWGNSYLTTYPAGSDKREAGYMLWNIALGAKTDPDPTRHAQYCSWLTGEVPTWNSQQLADGSWEEDDYGNPNYVGAPKAFTLPIQYEGAPWRQAINIKSLEAAYESLNDTNSQGCNDPTLAATTLTTIANAVTWQNNYGRSTTNRGIFYEVNSQSNDQQTVYHPAGTVSISLTSTALTGSGTGWQTAGYCDGTHFIGIEGSSNTVYKIASCTSDTAATVSVAYGFYSEAANASGALYSIAPAASTSCGASLATYCYTGASNGDRNLTRTVCGGMGWLYAQTLNSTYKSWTDECLSATLGGPTAGLTSAVTIGNFVLPCSGPACDGYVGDVVTSGPNCTDTGGAAPCTYGGSLWGNLGKNFGEAFGAPGIDNALAWRLLAPVVKIFSGKSTTSGKSLVH